MRHIKLVLTGFFLLLTSLAALASEPVVWHPDGSTSPSSVHAEVTYFLGKSDPLTNLTALEALGDRIHAASIEKDAWTDSFWNDIQGGIAAPYHDNSALGQYFPLGTFMVLDNKDLFFRTHGSRWGALLSLSDEDIAKMAPSEKYDLLVGDENFTLTRTVWDRIAFLHKNKPVLNKFGQIVTNERGEILYEPKKSELTPFWQGICNGWAAAALSLDRPLHSVVLTNQRGQHIKFHPADIRALASQLWARSGINSALDGSGPDAQPVIRHSGNRCNEKFPEREDNYRPKSPACNDVNPGTWHLAVLNRLGIDHQGFILDSKVEDSVWNHPLLSYEFRYLHPLSGAPGPLQKNKLPERKVDYNRKFRSPRARSIVTVEMTVRFLNNQNADDSETASAATDRRESDTYFYDLELDTNDEVVGGEWRNMAPSYVAPLPGEIAEGRAPDPAKLLHPDFIWAPLPGWKAFAEADRLVGVDYGTWDGQGAVPAGILTGAKRSSALQQPLAEVVDLLIRHSRE